MPPQADHGRRRDDSSRLGKTVGAVVRSEAEGAGDCRTVPTVSGGQRGRELHRLRRPTARGRVCSAFRPARADDEVRPADARVSRDRAGTSFPGRARSRERVCSPSSGGFARLAESPRSARAGDCMRSAFAARVGLGTRAIPKDFWASSMARSFARDDWWWTRGFMPSAGPASRRSTTASKRAKSRRYVVYPGQACLVHDRRRVEARRAEDRNAEGPGLRAFPKKTFILLLSCGPARCRSKSSNGRSTTSIQRTLRIG